MLSHSRSVGSDFTGEESDDARRTLVVQYLRLRIYGARIFVHGWEMLWCYDLDIGRMAVGQYLVNAVLLVVTHILHVSVTDILALCVHLRNIKHEALGQLGLRVNSCLDRLAILAQHLQEEGVILLKQS